MTWAVTIDFHNTIAACDEWFQLEVFDLIPAFLDWHAGETGRPVDAQDQQRGRELYRTIRRKVLDSGIERDAAGCVSDVLDAMEIPVDMPDIERGLEVIFRPTLEPARPMPGVVESVQELHARGVPLLVVSSAAYHPFLEWTLERFGIHACFQGVLTSADCGHYKSSPEIYRIAADMLGRRPDDCIHIGDSEEFDVRSAQTAGMRAALIDWDGAMAGKTEAQLRLETLCGLPKRLGDAFGCVPDAV